MASPRTTDRTLRSIVLIVAVVILVPVLLMVVVFPMMWGGTMGGYGGMMGGYGGMRGYGGYGASPLWGIAMLLVWLVVLVGGGYLLYRWLSGSRVIAADPALEELRLEYARGNITEEEYEERQARLREE